MQPTEEPRSWADNFNKYELYFIVPSLGYGSYLLFESILINIRRSLEKEGRVK